MLTKNKTKIKQRKISCFKVQISAFIKCRHWPIKLFFRQSKNILAWDKYQIRSSKGIRRYWLLMSMARFICCTSRAGCCSFEEGYQNLSKSIRREQIEYLYNCGRKGTPLDEILALVG